MKTISKFNFIVLLLIILIFGSTGSRIYAKSSQYDPITYQTFYDNLSPYGTWIDYPIYGHVWNPTVGSDFRPYATSGHWASTIDGWAWASDYDWGWAPFHYGSWLYDDMYGWLWIPGYDWSPAWVTWGYVDNYYCWAPIIPGLDLTVGFGNWRPNSYYWNACTREHIYDRNLSLVMERPEHFSNFQNRISLIDNYDKTVGNHFYYSKGPDINDVQKFTNTKIEQSTLRDVKRFDEANHTGTEMSVYRPNIQNPEETSRQFPDLSLSPNQYRKPSEEQARPIYQREQTPMLQFNEQRSNIESLPMFNSERRGSNLGQGFSRPNRR